MSQEQCRRKAGRIRGAGGRLQADGSISEQLRSAEGSRVRGPALRQQLPFSDVKNERESYLIESAVKTQLHTLHSNETASSTPSHGETLKPSRPSHSWVSKEVEALGAWIY